MFRRKATRLELGQDDILEFEQIIQSRREQHENIGNNSADDMTEHDETGNNTPRVNLFGNRDASEFQSIDQRIGYTQQRRQ
jgi:hypothetical protein